MAASTSRPRYDKPVAERACVHLWADFKLFLFDNLCRCGAEKKQAR